MNKHLFKKCQQCIKYIKKGKISQCKYYNFDSPKQHCLNCAFDKRIICELCANYDKETSFCKEAIKGKFRDNNTLRICEIFQYNGYG